MVYQAMQQLADHVQGKRNFICLNYLRIFSLIRAVQKMGVLRMCYEMC